MQIRDVVFHTRLSVSNLFMLYDLDYSSVKIEHRKYFGLP